MLVLICIYLSLFAWLLHKNLIQGLGLIIILLPTYLIRFKLGFVPFTLLEGMLWCLFLVVGYKNRNHLLDIFWNSKLKWLYIIAYLFLFSATLSLFYTPNLVSALGIWKAYFLEPILLILVLINIVKDEASLNIIFKSLGLSALIVAGLAIYQKFTGVFIPDAWFASEIRRSTSFYGYPNAVGLFLAPIIVLYIGLLWNYLQSKKCEIFERPQLFFYISVIGCSLLAIIYSKTEGAWLGVIMGTLWIMYNKIKPKLFYSILAVILFGVLFVPILNKYTNDKLNCFTSKVCHDPGLSVRLGQWGETSQMLKHNFIFGAGLAGYPDIFRSYHKIQGVEVYLYPHNIILNFWSEIGLFGLLIFILLIGYFFYLGRRLIVQSSSHRSIVIAIMAAMLTLLVHGLVDVPYFKNDLAILFWILVASTGCSYCMNESVKK